MLRQQYSNCIKIVWHKIAIFWGLSFTVADPESVNMFGAIGEVIIVRCDGLDSILLTSKACTKQYKDTNC